MNHHVFWQSQLSDAQNMLLQMQQDQSLAEQFEQVLSMCEHAMRNGNKLMFVGNGGSAADAQHLAAELVVRFKLDRPGLPALALTVDSSALTAIGNDFGFDQLFSRQVQAMGQAGDILFALSTSGKSENILKAVPAAHAAGVKVVALTGKAGGPLADIADICLRMPSHDTPRIQEGHTLIGHMLCEALELRLFA